MKKTLLALSLLCCLSLLLLGGCNLIVPVEEPAPVPEAPITSDVVLDLNGAQFAQNYIELTHHLDQYLGATIHMDGQVHSYGDEYPDLPIHFALLREYTVNDELSFSGLDCYYEGDLPADGSWIRIMGVLSFYTDEAEDVFPQIMVQSIAAIEPLEPLALSAEDLTHSH